VHTVNRDTLSLRSTLLLGAASAAALTFSLPAAAQDQSTETVVVTGSRIPQQGIYAPSPVTAVGQQELKLEGTTGVETLLNNLPSVMADQTSGASNGATGTATVNLRGLGANRTLVLVNGTRLMPGDPTNEGGGDNGAADLNQIPAGLVDHVEVLTGGASAVYGSDALAGVVNFVMRKDFEGIEVDGQYSVNQADNTSSFYRGLNTAAGFPNAKEGIWDGQNVSGTLIMGANTDNGKGNVTAYVGYQNTAAVLSAARDFASCSIGTNTDSNPNVAIDNTSHVCSGSSNYNRWISIDNYVGHTPYDFFETGTGHSGTGAFVPYTGTPAEHFNYGALNYLQRPDTRYQGGFFAHYEVNKELDVYTSFMFTDDYTIAQVAPSGLFLGTGTISGAYVQVNCNNPLMTVQEAAAICPGGGAGNITPGQALLEIGRRDIEGGNRIDNLRHTAYRAQIGARGDLGDGWSYDAYAQYGYTIFSENFQNEFSKSRVQAALEVDPTTGKCYAAEPNAQGIVTDSSCVPLDIFNGVGSITPQMLSYVKASGFQEGYTEEQIVSGNITGDLGQYGLQSPWAQSGVALSVGTEYRAEYLQNLTDSAFSLGENPSVTDLYGQGGAKPSVPRSGFNVVEGFGEIKVPLVQEKPFAEDLSFNAGYRYSSYSSSGPVSAYKYGLEYQPIDDFRLRASYERAVRAPNVLEAYAPLNVVLFTGQDPCAGITTGECATVPGHGSGILSCPANQCNQQVGGGITAGLNLKPEIGDTRTIGVVFTPTFIDGFTATVDYFNIDVSNALESINPNVTLAQCYGAGATAQSEAFFCPLVHRNAQGQIFGGGSYVESVTQNTGFDHTKGWDIEANYNLDLDSMAFTSGYGSVQFAFVGTYTQQFEVEPLAASGTYPGTGSYNCAGLYGTICTVPQPKWRHRLRVTWATPWDVDFSANWRFLSATRLDGNQSNPLLKTNYCTSGVVCSDPVDSHINDFWYLDLAADWNVRTGVDMHFGVNNVFDRLPPTLTTKALSAVLGNDNTYPGTYDSLGRTFFIGATIKY